MDISMLITLIIYALAVVSVILYDKKPFAVIAKVVFLLCAASSVYVGIIALMLGGILNGITYFVAGALWVVIAALMTKKTK